MSNRLSKIVGALSKLPGPVRKRALSGVMGTAVPFVGTAGIVIERLDASVCELHVPNRRRVQNHIGGVHAAAMTLLAETATGFVVALNVPDDRVPVVKSLSLEFKKRAKGSLRATARLTDEQRERIRTEQKGEVDVSVTLTDEGGREPIVAKMIWAWTPKVRAQ